MHETSKGRANGTENRRQTHKSFPSNQTHFHGGAVFHCGHNGADALFKEIREIDGLPRLIERQVPGQIDRQKVGGKFLDGFRRQ
jgi:hypothetical protein